MFIKNLTEKLVLLHNLSGCNEDNFQKFDLLESVAVKQRITDYINYQRELFSAKCEKETAPKFRDIVGKMDEEVRENVGHLGFMVKSQSSTPDNFIHSGELNGERQVISGIVKFLADKNTKVARKDKLTKEEFDLIYKSLVSGPCQALSFDFDQMARYYIRNYENKDLLRVCEESSKNWVFNFHLCARIVGDDTKLADFIYKTVLNQS